MRDRILWWAHFLYLNVSYMLYNDFFYYRSLVYYLTSFCVTTHNQTTSLLESWYDSSTNRPIGFSNKKAFKKLNHIHPSCSLLTLLFSCHISSKVALLKYLTPDSFLYIFHVENFWTKSGTWRDLVEILGKV